MRKVWKVFQGPQDPGASPGHRATQEREEMTDNQVLLAYQERRVFQVNPASQV